MGKRHSQTWTWEFDSPAEAIWPLLADTARFNEAAKLPQHEIEEQPRPDGSVLYLGRAKIGMFALEWEEKPVNWVSDQWFEHCRFFSRGPFVSLCAHFRLEPGAETGPGGCRGIYSVEVEPANAFGRMLLLGGFLDKVGKSFGEMAATVRACAKGDRETPFPFEPPPASERLPDLAAQIEASGYGHGLAERLAILVSEAQEVDLTQIRPLRLARLWEVPERETIELCLQATRVGLLELRWDLLCPRCRIAKSVVGSLDQLPQAAHCSTCNIDYDREFSRNVELSFRPAPTIRPLGVGEYCLFGPMSTPHIVVHVTLEPGETQDLAAELAPGDYRLRTLEPGPELDLAWTEGGFPEVIAGADVMRAGGPAPQGSVRVSNQSERRLTLVVESRAWVRDALTADRVTALQAFRDLFSDQVLRPGDEVSVRRVALLFTDLKGSTALYDRIGDAAAYHLVRDHFAFLAGIVREHDGAVVKTIGDAIMAAFPDPLEAVEAALAMRRQVTEFNAGHPDSPITIKLGLHEGPSIAVTLNGRLDYFGSTVNLAARLQNESEGGDIVVSETVAGEPAIAARLARETSRRESAHLKGFEAPVPFLRLPPLDPAS